MKIFAYIVYIITAITCITIAAAARQTPEPPPVEVAVEQPTPEPAIPPHNEKFALEPTTPPPEIYIPDPNDAEMLAQMIWGEAGGVLSEMEQAACAWCVLNRVDSPDFPDTVAGVLTQEHQFAGYSPDNPAPEDLRELAEDVLTRWHREKTENNDAGRVLPPEYFYFTGDGEHNHFRTDYTGGTVWDFTLPNPYDN